MGVWSEEGDESEQDAIDLAGAPELVSEDAEAESREGVALHEQGQYAREFFFCVCRLAARVEEQVCQRLQACSEEAGGGGLAAGVVQRAQGDEHELRVHGGMRDLV